MTKIQEVLGANSYVCRSYRGKTGRGGGLKQYIEETTDNFMLSND